MDKTRQPGIICDNVFLVSSSFERKDVISNQGPEDQFNFAVQADVSTDHKKAQVILTVTVNRYSRSDTEKQKPEITMVSVFVGLFRTDNEEPNMDLDEFVKNNAPAIILPYIRSHIQETFLKAAAPPSIIPPINVPAMLQQAVIGPH